MLLNINIIGVLMKELDEKIINMVVKTRNWAFKTKQSYINALNVYVEFNNGISFHDLLKEADKEEELGIRWKNRK